MVDLAKSLSPSRRGELEITDLNNKYLEKNQLKVEIMGRGIAWLDTGTPKDLIDAAMFVKTIEERQGLKIACVEEIAYNMEYISLLQLKSLAEQNQNSDYGRYLSLLAVKLNQDL